MLGSHIAEIGRSVLIKISEEIRMNRTRFVISLLAVLLVQSHALAQSSEVPKFELAAEFTTLERDAFFESRTEPGLGGRFTYNLNKVVSFETAAYFFPKTCFSCRTSGNITEVVGGLKVGKRFEKWGVFAKGRPGIASFSRGEFNFIAAPGPSSFPFQMELHRVNAFAADVGGVVEFYPSQRIVTRFDAGDTIIHFGRRTFNTLLIDSTGGVSLFPITTRARTEHSFQFVASVGFRF
jgi:hypothetical protein